VNRRTPVTEASNDIRATRCRAEEALLQISSDHALALIDGQNTRIE